MECERLTRFIQPPFSLLLAIGCIFHQDLNRECKFKYGFAYLLYFKNINKTLK